MSTTASTSGDFESNPQTRLLNIMSGLSRYQWSVVRTVRRIATASRAEYVASLSANALTAEALQSWEECIHELRHVLENEIGDSSAAKRNKTPDRSSNTRPSVCLADLFHCEWFTAGVCPFLTTPDACRMRAVASSLSTCVAAYAWDDLSCPVPFESMPMWRGCFPHACGVNVVLPALPHPSITSFDVHSAAVAPHDAIFEHFAGLRRLRVDGVKGYVISDAAFARLSGIVELEMPDWDQIALLTDEGLQHLAGIRKLNFTDTYSLHISSEGFRHLAGIQSLQVVAEVSRDSDNEPVWQMTNDALFHLRGIRELSLTGCTTDLEGDVADEGITDAGFAHLRGIQKLRIAAPLQISELAYSHLAGIVSLELGDNYDTDINDETLAYFSGVKSLTIEDASSVTDVGLRHLAGIVKLKLSNCPNLTGSGFVHLSGIQGLTISGCPLLTDAGFQYLKGIRVVSLASCPAITDAAFVHLAGIESLSISNCSQAAISDKAFAHLAGIQTLDLCYCTQSTITSEFLPHIAFDIQHLSIFGCPVDIDTSTFAKLRSLTSLRLVSAPQSTILAALQAFQGNAAVEPGLWKALSRKVATNILSGASGSDVLSPFYDLASATSVLPLLRAGISMNNKVPEAPKLALSGPAGLRGRSVEVVLAARLLLHVARRTSERSGLLANGAVSMLLAYIRKQSLGPILLVLCSALELLCEYPGFTAQVLEQGGEEVLVRVLSKVCETPAAESATSSNQLIAAAVCRSLCWLLTHQPAATGMALVYLDVMPVLLTSMDSTTSSASSSAAGVLAVALFRSFAVSSQRQRHVGGGGIAP